MSEATSGTGPAYRGACHRAALCADPLARAGYPSKRSGIASAVDEQILGGDISGLLRAEKRAIGAELGRPAETPGGVVTSALAPKLIVALAARRGHGAHMPLLRAAVEDAGQE